MKAINRVNFPGNQGGPFMHIIAAKAVCFQEALQPAFKEYAAQVVANAAALAAAVIERGYKLVSGGTDNHLFMISFRGTEITGKAAEAALDQAGITVNKNTVPGDERSPFVTSGVRIGTPAMTSRGMKESEMVKIAGLVADVLDSIEGEEANAEVTARVRKEVRELTAAFPLYPEA